MRAVSSVLVTGASGLLGTAVAQRLKRDGLTVLGLCGKHAFPGLLPVDLMQRDAVLDLARLEWDALVNCAAFRSPDFCEQARDPARVLNAQMPGWLARLARTRQAPFVHISTDYVFPGTRPPYREEAATEPVNFYGQTKVEAEGLVQEAHPEALILRIPALYGSPPAPVVSTLMQEGIEGATGSAPLVLDDVTVRYPTQVDDVAEVIAQAIPRGVSGILHVSAGEAATRYAWTCRICGWMGRDAARLIPGPQTGGRPARRPVDSHLATDKLRGLGLPVPRPFSDVMPWLLTQAGFR
jgi:dTDP-4-dehydrorhamnose reductase